MFKNNSFISRYNFQIPLIYITLFFIHFSVKETIIKCEFDKESALGTLLNSPIGGGRKEDPKRGHSKVRPKPTKSSSKSVPEVQVDGSSAVVFECRKISTLLFLLLAAALLRYFTRRTVDIRPKAWVKFVPCVRALCSWL
jgi:hypothetical protein